MLDVAFHKMHEANIIGVLKALKVLVQEHKGLPHWIV